MAKKREQTSIWKTNEAEKRLAQYKKRIREGMNRYSGDRETFIKNMALVMLAEVREERKRMLELSDEIRAIFEDFKIDE